MKVINKKKIVIGLIVILISVFCIIFLINNIKIEKVEEISPEEEISQDDTENITIIGYYYNIETSLVEKKECIINRSEILTELYKNILVKVMEKYEGESVLSVLEIIDLKLDKCEIESGSVSVYFSNNIEEFNLLENNMKNVVIEIIEKTLKEINGVNSVKVLLNNVEVVLS